MIAMDVEFLTGKFRVEWNDGRFILSSDKLVLEPEEFAALGELIDVFYHSHADADADCCGECS